MMEVHLKTDNIPIIFILILFFFAPNLGESQSSWQLDTIGKTDYVLFMRSDGFFNYLLLRDEPIKSFLPSEEKVDFSVPDAGLASNEAFLIIQFLESEKFIVFQSGKLIYKGEGDVNAPVGSQVYFSDFEEVRGTIENGKLNGILSILSLEDRGILLKEYNHGELNGSVKKIEKNGVITYFCQYKNGKKHGLEFELYDNGMLRFSRYYELGNQINCGSCLFDGDGNLIKY